MKKAILFSFAFAICIQLLPQTPEAINYQAIVRDISGDPLANQIVSLRFSILIGSTSGFPIYIETQTDTTNNFGLITLSIGKGDIISGNLSSIPWGAYSYFLKVEIDLTGSSAYKEMGTTQILSVPYSLYAKTAEKLSGNPFTHYIGESFGGGIVIYVEPMKDSNNEEHGLIISTEDLGWADLTPLAFINTSTNKWNGLYNTNNITVALEGNPFQGTELCINYRGGGFNDWYLPSIRELQLLWRNCLELMLVLKLDDLNSIFPFPVYCSSTLYNTGIASFPWVINLDDGSIYWQQELTNIIPIRAFRHF